MQYEDLHGNMMADGFLAIKSNKLLYEVLYMFLICIIGAARSPGICLCCMKLFAYMLQIVMLCIFFCLSWFLLSPHLVVSTYKGNTFGWMLFVTVCPVINCRIKPHQRYM